MLKGVNRQILEVTNPESPYFEKIIFFVKSETKEKSETELENEAKKIAQKMKKPPKMKRTAKEAFKTLGFCLLGLGAGSALMYLVSNVL